MIDKIKNLSDDFYDEIVAFRHYMHQHPELSFQEYATTSFITEQLLGLDVEIETNFAKTGVVALIKGNNPNSQCVAIRADIDALPIEEKTNLPFSSQNPGLMHACGHDIHAASVFGATKILTAIKNQFEGTVKVIFQPGEEQVPGGASVMIANGVLKKPEVRSIFAQHVFNDLPFGQVGFRSGLYMASADEFHITISGVGGHAALPEKIKDPIEAMNHLLIGLREVIRENTGEIPSVIAFGDIIARGATNVIPDNVYVKGTFRTLDENWRNQAHQLVQEVANKIARKFEVSIDLGLLKGYPFLYNEEDLTNRARQYAEEYLGKENVVELPMRMSSEDFAFYTHHVPGCFYRLGTSNSASDLSTPVHTATFQANDQSLKTGAGLMAYLVWNELAIGSHSNR